MSEETQLGSTLPELPPPGRNPEPAATQLCAICQSPIAPDQTTTPCPACCAVYHSDCWEENRGCAIYGCSQVPPTEGRSSVEVPVAYWGQERKPCPNCGMEILAAAVRCRHCGAVFESAKPLDADEFNRARALNASAPRLRKTILTLFVLCLIPFMAPIALLVGWFWHHSNRDGIERLPSLYSALIKIGFAAGLLQILILISAAVTFSLLR